MNRDSAVARIQQGLGFRTNLTDAIISALQEAQRRLERGRTLPLFLRQESQSLILPAGDAEILFPQGFIREDQEEGLNYPSPDDPDEVIILEKVPYNVGHVRFADEDAGRPIAYTIRRNSFHFWPVRDIQYTLTYSWYKRSVSLATNTGLNEWLQEDTGMPEALIGRAGMIVAEDLADAVSLAKFTKMYAEAWSGATAEDQLRDEENQPLAMGSRS